MYAETLERRAQNSDKGEIALCHCQLHFNIPSLQHSYMYTHVNISKWPPIYITRKLTAKIGTGWLL
jgi:hypothetical protein